MSNYMVINVFLLLCSVVVQCVGVVYCCCFLLLLCVGVGG